MRNASIVEMKVVMKVYSVSLKKSGTRVPVVSLSETGPHAEFSIRRTRWASESLKKESLRVPKVTKPKKVKNISYNEMGDKTGRIHMQKQDLGKLQTRKVKALKRAEPGTGPEPSPSPEQKPEVEDNEAGRKKKRRKKKSGLE